MFLTFFPFLCPIANRSHRSSLISSFLKSYLSTPIALYKRVTVSDLLRSLMTKEWQELFILFHEQIALLLTNNKWIAQKNDEQSKNKTLVQDQHELFYLLKLVGKKKELKWKR